MSLKPTGKAPRPNLFEDRVLTNRERGDAHERDTAKKVKGRTQPNSGASPFVGHKGDVKSDEFLYQCKLTDKARFTITQTIIAEIVKQSTLTGRDPAIVVKLEGLADNLPNEWVMITMSKFQEMINDKED